MKTVVFVAALVIVVLTGLTEIMLRKADKLIAARDAEITRLNDIVGLDIGREANLEARLARCIAAQASVTPPHTERPSIVPQFGRGGRVTD